MARGCIPAHDRLAQARFFNFQLALHLTQGCIRQTRLMLHHELLDRSLTHQCEKSKAIRAYRESKYPQID
jgi:hypothetical protein